MKRAILCRTLVILLCMAVLVPTGAAEGTALPGEASDPCALIDFTGEGGAMLRMTDGPDGCCAYDGNGVFLSGKYASWSGVSFSLPGSWSFGDEDGAAVCRLRIDGLARQGTNVVMGLFLDDEDEPFAVKQLNVQSEEGNWQEEKPVFAEIAEPFRGEHSIRFTVEDSQCLLKSSGGVENKGVEIVIW